MIKVTKGDLELEGSYLDINNEVSLMIYSYVRLLQSDEHITDSVLMADLLEYMKEIQFLVGCVSRGESVEDKFEEMVNYVFD